MTSTLARAGILCLLLGLAAACSPRHVFDNPERPAPTPDPEIPGTFAVPDLHGEMWKLAHDVERVNVIMRRDKGPLTEEEQAEILSLLDAMGASAARLAEADARTIHPVLGKNIDQFRSDLAVARRSAAADPPNFFMAGTIAGACAYCHGIRFDQVHSMSPGSPTWKPR